MKSRTALAIIGAGGFGREVAWLVDEINEVQPSFELVGFVDDTGRETPEGYPLLGTIEEWIAQERTSIALCCAIGDPLSRRRVTQRFEGKGFQFAKLIHPSVRASRWVEIGDGSMVCAGCILTTNIHIGPHALINLDCTVGHDATLGSFCSMMPGVHISGDVKVGEGGYFGTGAVVINAVNIGSWTVVGAGAVVTSDLPDHVVAVGVPAKAVKANSRFPE